MVQTRGVPGRGRGWRWAELGRAARQKRSPKAAFSRQPRAGEPDERVRELFSNTELGLEAELIELKLHPPSNPLICSSRRIMTSQETSFKN